MDSSGNVYAADRQSQQIIKISPAGSVIGVWTNAGPGVGLGGLGGIAVSPASGNIYVGLAGGVAEFTPAGAVVKVVGYSSPSTSCTRGSNFTAQPVAVDPAGNVYTSVGGCIGKFTPDLEPVLEFGGVGTFANAGGIAITPSGRLFVVDLGNRVQEFDPAGNLLAQWGGSLPSSYQPAAIAATKDGNLLVSTLNQGGRSPYPPFGLLRGALFELRSPSGQLLGTYSPGPGFGPLSTAVAEAPSGVLYWAGFRSVTAIDPTEPEARLSATTMPWVLTGQAVNLDARESRVVFAPPTFAWDLGTGSYSLGTGITGTTSTSFSTPGIKTVGVSVGAPGGKAAIATRQIDVRPAPPAGQVGLTVDEGDYATNSRNVTLSPVWFPGATSIVIANDGGFRGAGPQALAGQVPWTLAPGGTERLPKTVYVRYLGAGQDTATFTDDIILDTTTPVIEGATEQGGRTAVAASVSKAKTYRVKLRAAAKISGVSAVAIGRTKRRAKTTVLREPTVRGISKLRRTFVFKGRKPPRFVRVQSAAGTWSKWAKIGKPAAKRSKARHSGSTRSR